MPDQEETDEESGLKKWICDEFFKMQAEHSTETRSFRARKYL